jgi:Domain of unknown function (DUF4259)
MGSQETGNFGNDDASDWVFELEESSGPGVLKEAFKAVQSSSYPDTADSCIALAAAEVVAAAKGMPSTDLPDDVRKWIEDQEAGPIQSLVKAAITAVNKVSTKSELRDSWEESDSWHDWQQVVEGLRRRLQA